MKALRWIDKALARIEGWLIITLLWLMVTLTFVQVCLRGLYTHAHLQWANSLMGYLDWSEPFVRLLVLWLTFLGASLITGDNKHIKIDLFSTLLSPKGERTRELLLSLVCVVISAIMVKACIDYIKMEMEFDHVGIITTEKKPDEMYIAPTKVWVTRFMDHPYHVEWLRYEPDSPVTGPVREMPHVAYRVDDIEAAGKGLKVLLEPFDVGFATVAFFQTDDGAVVEFMKYKENTV